MTFSDVCGTSPVEISFAQVLRDVLRHNAGKPKSTQNIMKLIFEADKD